jgi:hypothetical protein
MLRGDADLLPASMRPKGGVLFSGIEVDGSITLEKASVPFPAKFSKCRFRNEIDLLATTVKGDLEFTDCHLAGGINLERAHIEGDLEFHRCDEIGLGSITRDICVASTGVCAHSLSVDRYVALRARRVHTDGRLSLEQSIFGGTLELVGARIDGDFTAVGTKFPEANYADLSGLRVTGQTRLDNAKFRFATVLAGSEFGGDVWAKNLRCEKDFMAENLRCAKAMHLTGSVFERSLDLRGSSFGGTLDCDHVTALDINLEIINAGDKINLRKTTFAGPFTLEGATSRGDLDLQEVTVKPLPPGGRKSDYERRMDRIRTGGALKLDGSQRRVSLAGGREVIESMGLESVYHRNLQFDTISFRPTALPFYDYEHVCTPHEPDKRTWTTLETYMENWHQGRSNYLAFEDYFRRRGYSELADQVHIDMERAQTRNSSLPTKVLRGTLGELTGYGKRPWQALFVIIPVVLCGWRTFRKEEFMYQIKPEEKLQYSGFWYSLGNFLPLTNIGECDSWRPKGKWRRRFLYLYVILGWILVPIGLLSLSTWIK